MSPERMKPSYTSQSARSGSNGPVTITEVSRRRSPDPAQLLSNDQTKATQSAPHQPIAKLTIPTTPKTLDGVVLQPTPENAHPVENGGGAGAASEVVVTTMPGSDEPMPGTPVLPAAAISELSSAIYDTQNGATVEVPGDNATARADATMATPGSLADVAHDLPTIRRVRVDTVLIGNGRRASNPEHVRTIADSIAQVGLINPITVTIAQTQADVGASGIGATVNLVAGLNRLEAHKLLGLTHIDAIVVASDRIDDRLREIAENLWRVELTVLERSELVEEWTKLIREKAGQVAHPGGLQPNDQGISRAAKELGLTREDVRRSKVVAGISPEAKAAAKAGHLSDNQKALLDIAKQPTPEAQVEKVREKVARKQTARHKLNAKAAVITPPTPTPSASAGTGENLALPAFLDRRDPEEVYASVKTAWANSPAMVAAWADAPPVVQARFIAEDLLNSATITSALNALIGKTYKRAKRGGLPRREASDE